ncbi:hypothetical protein BD324DRAFT_614468 [Kockovaella imperatae]|uniref:N-acetyltransferase domain-containing protein n=1 Tax=Kockovaella imperatae TaxID=4999 RepID=A0A1Y1UQ04_9TREE|nr:hypothetical protein BD324DRAFT_614468 [Kockovaella imperatae]ORX39647.1 hypothetical protein BD324DRAFT_614468 [Kockovaella imperatae]
MLRLERGSLTNLNPKAWLIQAGNAFHGDVIRRTFQARAKIGTDDGFVWVIGQKEGDIQGALHALPPGYTFGQSKNHPEGIPSFKEQMDPELRKWKEDTYLPWVTDAFHRGTLKKNTSVKESLYLSVLGVDPSTQRNGYGRALVRTMQEEAASLGVPLTLGCGEEDTVRWYQRLGFEETLKETIQIRGENQTAHVLVWTPKS